MRHTNRVSRRDFLKVSTLTATGALLAACAPQAAPPAVSNPAGQAATQAPAATSAPAKGAPVTIRYGRWANPAEVKAGQALIDQFQGAQSDIKVEPAFLPWGDYWPKVQAELAAGTASDVIQMSVWYIVDFMENNALVDLTDNIKSVGITPEKYFTNSLDQWKVNGKVGCLPTGLYAGALFYNKKLFDDAKVPYPQGDVTWDDVLSIGTKMTVDKAGKHPDESGFDPKQIARWGFVSTPGLGNGVAEGFMAENGGGVMAPGPKCLLNTPESVEAMQFMFDLVSKYHISPTPEEIQGIGNPFLGGVVAMMQDNHSRVTEANMTKGLSYDITLPPTRKKGARKYGNVGANGNAIYAKSKNGDAAWKFLQFTVSKPVQEGIAKLKEIVPFNKEVANSPVYLDPPPDHMHIFIEGAELPDASAVNAVTKHMGEWNAAAQKDFEAAWLGKTTVQQAADQACQDIDKILSGK